MNLSNQQLAEIVEGAVLKPPPETLDLPERVLQFGTGVLLRGLPDFFIDEANRKGLFGGRIVVIKSTAGGSDGAAFDRQDNLYTLCIRGIEHGHRVVENRISSAISRVLSASGHWEEILALARKDTIQIIISNTTEVGIQAVEEDIHLRPPASFPGKLLAFLYARYQAGGAGFVIIPTELISDNGPKLKAIVLDLARYNDLGDDMIDWLENHNRFCSSLVDRIVPGRPDRVSLDQLQTYLGYEDDLLLVCESYRLWAIEGDKASLKDILGFAAADAGIVIAPSIEVFKELKLRLLNGTHTLCCGLAFLSGFDTVRDAMEDETFADFLQTLMLDEIVPAIPISFQEGEARAFGLKVLDRFRNPYLEHRWLSITLQYSSKMKLRVVPLLLHTKGRVPAGMTKGFAAHILFMRPIKEEGGKYFGESRGVHYPIQDDKASVYAAAWASGEPVHRILQDVSLWETDLTNLEGFEEAVTKELITITEKGGLS
jgi:tagaturonate reductase